MKPRPFDYDDPETVDEAVALLGEHGEDAKVLAGGQSLIPLLNFRLASPPRLVDINRIPGLSSIRRRDGVLHIGALARQARLERSNLAAADWPLLVQATRLVAHAQIRNRGTVGGSVAHADAAAEIPVALLALDARLRLRSIRGERVVAAQDFFVTHLTTALDADELLLGIEVPSVAPGSGHAFVEVARRNGDFALAGAAVVLELGADGSCGQAAVALLGAGPTPVRSPACERLLQGAHIDAAVAREAAEAGAAATEPTGDLHGSTAYRRSVLATVLRRAILEAIAHARKDRDADTAR